MTDYTELVKALRGLANGIWKNSEYTWFGGEEKLFADAAAAIEDLQAQLPKQGEWVETEEKEWGIYPFKKQTCSVCDCKIDHIFMLACMDYFDDRDTVFHYCPNCGAKMEVQDGK